MPLLKVLGTQCDERIKCISSEVGVR
jgi:hypothetical protein